MTFGTRLSVIAVAVGAGALLLAVGGWAVHDAGRTKERVLWQDKEAQRAAQFAKDLEAEYARGRAASTRYQLGASALQARYFTLEGPFHDLRRRVSLVVPSAVPDRRAERPGDPARPVAPRADPDAVAPGDAQRDPVDRGHRLSLAAVWLWNSALAGTDVPAGACGLADTSVEACAADAGLTVDDAWDNHHLNAKSCATDRLRHRALIEFITERPAP
ncbi:hypothetical protein J2W27_003520 [Variovorax boronicumulans]|uniref:hypothetical protein n=1 Tax=Variovorax boronicumulans TaxID=436515 RepID=UPI002786B406|nr:hypothetical protein [Variovorax boronicumulans]MDP9911396.1 hypothetical protein [Variovorax boronicumulans]